MSKGTKTAIVYTVLASSVMLSGCSLFGGGEKEIDPPKDVSYLKDASELKDKTVTKTKETAKAKAEVKTELYLIDKNGYVVPQTLNLPASEGVAKQALEYLVAAGPVEELLPNGFKAVLPADTKVDLDVNKNGVATADFSKEFKNYKKEDELKILQAVTWTLTQFDSIKKVNIRMEGRELTRMPVNNTPVSKGLTRSIGINADTSGITDISNTRPVTVYYMGGKEGSYYYVPVTRRVSDQDNDLVTAALNELVKGPAYSSGLLSDFVPEVALLDPPKNKDGRVTLNFNKSVLNSTKNNQVSSYLLNSLVLSLTEQKGIESVEVLVDGKPKITTENGKAVTEPVTRPEKVNTGSF
ncbi:GerMN domain-containing protein [Peribacillus kribbensis]|uniref:GerMN domain-containing protein n=1 Tax=Peribacillus kribbensis TaxID=356658 RepID=UPI00042101CA|nr:GerMN domain-containing protein [Peribacillus kribbensis]